MPLRNRVLPDGDIISSSHRGTMMGNRGGKFHNPSTQELLPIRRWASRQWICCVTDFKNRSREVMGQYYTELFFLDEVTALAAGHRPCFECRRKAAVEFAEHWQSLFKLDQRPKVRVMDDALHNERLDGRKKRTHRMSWHDIPDGTAFSVDNEIWVRHQDASLLWSTGGYRRTSRLALQKSEVIECLTPPTIVEIMRAGYQPQWHPTAAHPIPD